jgi:hypothetical protein
MMAFQSEVTRTDIKGAVWGLRQKVTVEEALRIGCVLPQPHSARIQQLAVMEAGTRRAVTPC